MVFTSGAAVRRCSSKKVFLNISEYLQEALMLEPLFNEVLDLKDCNFIKKRLQHRCFPVNIEKFTKTVFSMKHFRQLLLLRLQPQIPLFNPCAGEYTASFPKYLTHW